MPRATRIAIVISIFAVAARFIAINQPFEDLWSWRQSDVAAIARNYFQGGFHFNRPQIDWAGNSGGYVGTEFPILPFVAAISYKAFGIHEWVGRIQAVIFFTISLPFFFWLVRDRFGELAAIWALLFYSFAPLGIMASRCFMPDTPSLALSIIGLFLFQRWTEDPRSRSAFLWSAVCISLSILVKATSVIIGVPLACLAIQHFGIRAVRNPKLWLFATIALVPSALWYWHSYQISLEFYPHHFFGAGGVKMMSLGWYWKIAKEIPTLALTPFLFGAAIIGFIMTRSTRLRQGYGAASIGARPFGWWLGAMMLFIILVGYGNRHPWYRLPLVPIAAVFGGVACAWLAERIASRGAKLTLSVLMVALFSLSCLIYARTFYQPIAAPIRDAGLELKRVTPPNSLIAAADNGDPTLFYYAERKGWHFLEKDGIYYGDPDGSEPAIVDLEQLRAQGAEYLAFTSNTSWWLDLYPELREYVEANSKQIAATPEFKIYRLNPKPE